MLIVDGSGGALAVNQRWSDLTGMSRTRSLGQGWLGALDTDNRSRLRTDVLRVAAGGPGVTADYQLSAALRRRWARWWVSRHELEGVPLVAIAAADMDDDYARQASLYHLATHDSLTGLVNRSHFLDSIEAALRRNQRAARHVGVVYVDLDGFKRVNDRGGHSLGDRVLYAIAARLRHAVRAADTVARIGGDEFAVLCEGLGAAEQAEVVARRIGLALTESVELDGERWSVAASVGAAVDQGAPDTAEDLIDRADRAMYSIKRDRRGTRLEPDDRSAADDLRPADAGASGPAGGGTHPERAWDRRETPDAGPNLGRRATDRPPVTAGPAGASAPAPVIPAPLAPTPVAPTPVVTAPAPPAVAPRPPVGPGPVDQPTPAPPASPPAGDADVEGAPGPARTPADDVVALKESIESIRRMLDGLIAAGDAVIDIRDGDASGSITDRPIASDTPRDLG